MCVCILHSCVGVYLPVSWLLEANERQRIDEPYHSKLTCLLPCIKPHFLQPTRMFISVVKPWFLPRDAMLAQYMLSSCVRLPVTCWYCIIMAKLMIMQTPYDIPETSFLMPNTSAKFERDHHYGGAKCR